MFLHRSILAIAAGFGLVQAGCFAQSNEMGVEAIDDLALGVLNTPGDDDEDPSDPTNTGQNGLETLPFHRNKSTLAMAFLEPLYDRSGHLNTHVQTLVDPDNDESHDVFRYAAKCLVPDGTNIFVVGQKPYGGEGLLNMSDVWANSGLGQQGSNEGFACMAAHLNPSGVHVPIKFGGYPVHPDQHGPTDKFTFKEALWAGEVISPSDIKIHVWPLDDLYDVCMNATNDAMSTRVCGDLATGGDCGLIVHSNAWEECIVSPTGVSAMCTVNGVMTNVIQTWLDPKYVPKLYGACYPSRPGPGPRPRP